MIFKKIQKSFLYIIILVTIILNLSCNYFTEPEPFVNKDAHPPKTHYGNAKFINYSEDQIVTGTITVGFTLDWNPMNTDSVIVFVDSTRIAKIDCFIILPLFNFNLRSTQKRGLMENII